MVPINDLGTGTYMGMMGGLYPNGSNTRPAEHLDAGLAFAAQVQPLNPAGLPDTLNGRIVWLSIGSQAEAFLAFQDQRPPHGQPGPR